MKSARLTLKQLSHFDRCLKVDSFQEDLIRFGVRPIRAEMASADLISKGYPIGIAEVARSWHKFPDVLEAINKILLEWDEKFPDES